MQLLAQPPKLFKKDTEMRNNASFGGEDLKDEDADLDGICDSLRDEQISDQMSDGACLPASTVDREIQAKPIAHIEQTKTLFAPVLQK